jgi:hypothetical protein
MSNKNDDRIFHSIYNKEILENMKRYYKIDSDNELVKYIKYVKRNHIVEPNEVDNVKYSEGQQDIKVQSNINQSEQCSAKVQSLIQRAQDAIDSGEYGQWRSRVVNEIQQLNKECPEQMQGQQ